MNQRVDAHCLVVDDERVLMVRMIEGSRATWTLPGGVVRFGEDPRDTAARVLTAQTGITATVAAQPFFVASRVLKSSARSALTQAEDLHTIGFYFRARTSGGALTQPTADTMDRAEWFSLAELPRNRFRFVAKALDEAGVTWAERAAR